MPDPGRWRVLLVDDEPSILLTFRPIVETLGCDVQCAASAQEALALIELEEFDLVITDIRMETPASGLDVIRAARKKDSKTAVAVMTAFPLTRGQRVEAGTDAIFLKGAAQSVAEMLRTIQELLQARPQR